MYDARTILTAFLRSIDNLTAGGGKVSDTFTGIRARYDQVLAASDAAAVAKLSDFVLEGNGRKKLDEDTLAQMITLALAEVSDNGQARAEVLQRIAGQTLATLKQEYKENCAEDNLLRLGEYVSNAAEKLSEAVELCDPDLSVERVVAIEDNDQRTAWNMAPALNQKVEAALQALTAAAELLGVQPTRDNLFHLVVDVRHLERKRPAFEVWDGNTGRSGRFADLLKLGARIAPVESIEELHERMATQGRPGPIETRYVREEYGSRPVEFDPDDPSYEEQLQLTGAFRA